jgi:hypothetical protein
MHKKRENGNNTTESRHLETNRIRRGFERGKCPLCMGEEGAKYRWLRCPEMKKQRELVCSNG